jgi:hypothetical protein
VHVVAKWMGHDAKVSLKHYAQITESHFSKAIGEKSARSTTPTESQPKPTNEARSGGAKSGAVDAETGAQNAAQQVLAVAGTTPQTPLQVFAPIRSTATGCKRVRTSANSKSGEGGIRTPGWASPTPVFKTGAINRSATSPADSVATADFSANSRMIQSSQLRRMQFFPSD